MSWPDLKYLLQVLGELVLAVLLIYVIVDSAEVQDRKRKPDLGRVNPKRRR